MNSEKHDNQQLVFETQQQVMWQIAGYLTKGSAFYFAILAAFLGYVMAQELSPNIEAAVLYGVIAISILYMIAAGAIVKSLRSLLKTIESHLKATTSIAFDELNSESFFSEVRKAARIVGVCSFFVWIVILSGNVFLFNC